MSNTILEPYTGIQYTRFERENYLGGRLVDLSNLMVISHVNREPGYQSHLERYRARLYEAVFGMILEALMCGHEEGPFPLAGMPEVWVVALFQIAEGIPKKADRAENEKQWIDFQIRIKEKLDLSQKYGGSMFTGEISPEALWELG